MTEHFNGLIVSRGTRLSELTATPPKKRSVGRVCARAGCSTRLSIYNPDRYCSPHAPFVDLRGGPTPGRKKVA